MQEIQNQGISQQTKILIRLLVLGKFTLAEVARVTGIPEQELKSYLDVNSHLEPQQLLP
jgi:DNA-directed RNA polymerase specialized sigma24 family protein